MNVSGVRLSRNVGVVRNSFTKTMQRARRMQDDAACVCLRAVSVRTSLIKTQLAQWNDDDL